MQTTNQKYYLIPLSQSLRSLTRRSKSLKTEYETVSQNKKKKKVFFFPFFLAIILYCANYTMLAKWVTTGLQDDPKKKTNKQNALNGTEKD